MKFLKVLLASILGTIIGLFLLFLIFFISLLRGTSEPEPYIRSGTILTIDLAGDIPARTIHDPFGPLFNPLPGDQVSLESLRENLEKAAADARIEGIWLRLNPLQTSWANLESAYEEIRKFRESGKFIYASTDDIGLNENAYFLATLADSIFAPPETRFEFNGFVMQIAYYSSLLDKIGVEPEIVRVGAWKSAVESFTRRDSSPENREQMMELINGISDTFIRAVEENRGLPRRQIEELLNEIPSNSVRRALESGLIDAIAHPGQVEQALRSRLGMEEDQEIRTVSFNRYSRVTARSAGVERTGSRDRIAVIYASGIIIPQAVESPYASEPVITAKGMKESLKAALDDDDVKAIVIHIDSGGGALSTSELIRGIIRDAASEKPVIAYMGGVAASGGYYIAMGADAVVASPNTITGSIGIYSMLFNARELFNEKLGIHFDEFKSHDHADLEFMNRQLEPYERDAMQRIVENGYETFLDRVSERRGMSRDEVHRVAQGRIWIGERAAEINLVDRLGTLETALQLAADRAGITDYSTVNFPRQKDLFELIFSSAGTRIAAWTRSLLPLPAAGTGTLHPWDELVASEGMSGRTWALLPLHFTIQ